MGIDFDNRYHQIATYHEYSKQREKNLRKMGFAIDDTRVTRRPTYERPYLFDDKIPPRDYYRGYEESTVWHLKADDQLVDKIVNLVDQTESLQRNLQYTSHEAANTQRELMAYQKKLANLRKTLRENPGLQEQWDELMVMMKLAGFDENLA